MVEMEHQVQAAMLVPVVAAGTVVAELILTIVKMMIVVVEEVQVLLGTHKLSNMYQLVTQLAKIIL